MNEKITTSELAELLAEKAQMTNEESGTFVKEIFALIFEVLQDDKYLKIKGLGTFKLISVNNRESVDVNTGERIMIEGYDKISFTPETALRDLVNKPFAHFDTVVLNEGIEFEEEIPEEVIEEEEEVHIVLKEKKDDAPIKEKETKKKVSTQSNTLKGTNRKEKNIPKQEKNNSEKENNSPIIEKEEYSKEEISKEAKIKSSRKPPILKSELQEKLAQETKENFENKKAPILDSKPPQKQSDLSSVKTAKTIKDSTTSKVPVTKKSEIIFDIKEEEQSSLHEETILQSEENNIIEEENQPSNIPSNGTYKRNYKVPFYLCLSFLIVLIASIIMVSYTSPQWFKDLFHLEGQTITIVTVNPKEKKATIPKKKVAEDQSSPKENQQQQKVHPINTPTEKQSEKTLWITEKHVNPNNFKIVGTLTEVTLQSGNSLAKLSKKYYGTTDLWALIVSYNKDIIKDPDYIPIGSSLKIPKLEKK